VAVALDVEVARTETVAIAPPQKRKPFPAELVEHIRKALEREESGIITEPSVEVGGAAVEAVADGVT
jgi:hypothetical protein